MRPVRSLLTPEEQLILLPDSPEFDDGRVRELLDRVTSWQTLLELADRERVFLPLWRRVRDSGASTDAEGPQVLKRMAEIWHFKLIHLERLLRELLEALDREGCPVVVMKGAAAAMSVHGGFSKRPMFDADLHLRPADAEHAWILAQEMGWQWDAERFPRSSYEGAHHLPPLLDEFGAGAGLEFHTSLIHGGAALAIPEDEIIARCVSLDWSGLRVRVPQLTDQLLHSCVHFAWSHGMNSHGWRTFTDVGAYVRSGGVEWDRFVRDAASSRTDTCCYWTLALAASLMDVPVPEGELSALRPSLPKAVLDRLERHFALNLLPAGTTCPSVGLKERLWRLGIGRGAPPEEIDLPESSVPAGLASRIESQLRGLGSWYRYLGRVG